MWEHTLLQIAVAITPIIVFQMWSERTTDKSRYRWWIFALFGSSIVFCALISSCGQERVLDFSVAPLLIGSLYGGTALTLALAAVYAVCGLLLWESAGMLEYTVQIVLVLASIIAASKPFRSASRAGKQWIAGLAATVLFATALISRHPDPSSGFSADIGQLVHVLTQAPLYYFAIFLMVFLSEDYLERSKLSRELAEMSNNYRNEVQKLQQFIEETPLGVIFVDRQGFITHINDKALNMFQLNAQAQRFTKAELLGRPYTSLLPYDGIQGKLLGDALLGLKTRTELVTLNNKNYLKTSIAIREAQAGAITGAAVISHDITELNRLRDEIGRMERLSLVGQMAASITHEIRNPMAVIRGFVQLMRERSPEHQHEYYRIVMDELDRANGIINDFLSLAQNRVIEKQSCSLHDIINDIMPLLWADANLRGQSVELELAELMPALMLNEKEIKQLILNLARNGMEAMDQKGVLRLQTRVCELGIELRVIDTGTGIAKEKLERLFEPFFTTKTRGTGLGLPLCLSIAERHNGHILVESTEGQGTEFIVRFGFSDSEAIVEGMDAW